MVGWSRWLGAALGACALVVGGVFALNVVADPFDVRRGGVLPPAVEVDRQVKLDLVDRLRRAPEVLVLGSSRARMAEPQVVRRLTGRRAFNAAVTGGTAVDGYVFARYVAARFPRSVQRVIWFVDADTLAGNGVNPQLVRDRRAAAWLPEWAGDGRPTPGELGRYVGVDALTATLRVAWACIGGGRPVVEVRGSMSTRQRAGCVVSCERRRPAGWAPSSSGS